MTCAGHCEGEACGNPEVVSKFCRNGAFLSGMPSHFIPRIDSGRFKHDYPCLSVVNFALDELIENPYFYR